MVVIAKLRSKSGSETEMENAFGSHRQFKSSDKINNTFKRRHEHGRLKQRYRNRQTRK